MRQLISFRIEGLGLDTSVTTAADIGYHYDPEHGWGGVAQLGESTEDRINPQSGEIQLGAFEPVLAGGPPKPGDPDPLTLLRPSADAVGTLTSGLSADLTDDTVELDATGLGGQVVYVGPEAILLGTGDGSGTYTGCTRGMWGPQDATIGRAYDHDAGASVYDDLPAIRGQRIWLHVTDEDGTTTVPWSGVIKDLDVRKAGAEIKLSTDHILSVVLGEVPIGPGSALDDEDIASASFGDDGGGVGLADGYTPQIHPKDYRVDDQKPFSAQYRQALGAGTGGAGFALRDSPLDVDTGDRQERKRTREAPIRPVAWIGKDAAEENVDPIQLTDPHHPLSVAEGILRDQMQAPWSLRVRAELPDYSNLITETAQLQIDSLILGWDGESAPADEVVIAQLLRAFGFALGVDEGGRPSFQRLARPGIADRDRADSLKPLPDTLEVGDRLGQVADSVTFLVGGDPWEDGSGREIKVPVSGVPGYGRRLTDEEDVNVRVPGVNEERAPIYLGAFQSETIKKAKPDPTLHCQVNDSATELTLGAVYTVEDLPVRPDLLVDRDEGMRFQPSDRTGEVAVRLLGRQYHVGEGKWSLHLQILSELAVRWRAPSAVAKSVTDNEISFAQGGAYETDGGNSFAAGMEIQLFDGSLRPISGQTVYTVQAAFSDGLELDGQPSSADLPAIVRLADYDAYQPDGSGVLSSGRRLWAYIAEDTQPPGLGQNDDTADIYGV